MKALVFRHNLAREAAATIGGRVDRHAFVSRLAPVRIEDVDELPLPAPDWVRVQTTFSGLCGSDVKQILLNGSRDNPLTALVSFPHVLGHEVVGRRADTGERVVLNPWLSCGPRGIDPPCEIVTPGKEGIHPRSHRVPIGANVLDGECRAPSIVAQRDHRHALPCRVAVVSIEQQTRELVVPIGKAVGFDHDLFAQNALDRKTAAVDRGHDRFDHRANRGLGGRRFAAPYFAAPAHFAAPALLSGLSRRHPSGGSVSVSACARPCAGTGAASTAPKLPTPLPP